MKDPFERTKVVVRHLPPTISQSVLMEQIDGRFAGRYKWLCFRSGKSSQKNQRYSHIYIDFNRPDDVVEFAEFFDGHVFVNEKGTQFKAVVEYAPSQLVPKSWNKKDGREGTITKDPEYLEFLEFLAKPVENLPSAEIQLEKKEAERAVGIKEAPIVTPLMLFVRKNRAAKSALQQRGLPNVKISRRIGGGISSSGSGSYSSKRGSERRRASTTMYVLRDSAKNASRKDKSTFILMSRIDQKQLLEKSATVLIGNEKEVLDSQTEPSIMEMPSGGSAVNDSTKKKVAVLKGKEREVSMHQLVATSPSISSPFKQIPRHGANNTVIRNVPSKDAKNLDKVQVHSLERDRRPPRAPTIRLSGKDQISNSSDGDARITKDKVSGYDMHFSLPSDKQDKRIRNKDRHDRGIWALRRSDGSYTSDDHDVPNVMESMEGVSTAQQTSGNGKIPENPGLQGTHCIGRGGISAGHHDGFLVHGEIKDDSFGFPKGVENRTNGGRGSFTNSDNGIHRYGGRRGVKECDGSGNLSEGKHSKRGMAGYGSHEKQIWVQKTGSS